MVRIARMMACVSAMLVAGGAQADLLADLDRVSHLSTNPQLMAKAKEAGYRQVDLCKFCHGVDGNSVRAEVPNLAGQSPQYLLKQLHDYINGERQHVMMQDIAPTLQDENRINVVMYYSSRPVESQHPGSGSPKGKKIYVEQCASCHGQDAMGTPEIPRIASQRKLYLSNALKSIKAGKPNRKFLPLMEQAIMKLPDEDIDAVVDYLAGLKTPR